MADYNDMEAQYGSRMNAESQREAIFARLSGNKSGLCLCPAHNDKNPSLHVSVSNGKLLLRCHAGCAQADVMAALTELGLWAKPEPKSGNGHGFDYALRTEGKPIATWPYTDANGKTLFVIARYAQTNGHKSFRPWTYIDGKWECKRFAGRYPLFVLHAISSNDLPVVVVEGEKCAIALDSLLGGKYCVTTWAGGAQAVNNTDWSPIGKRKVIVWPDADPPGAKACEDICRLLPHASALRVDDKPAGWDCAEAIAEGWNAAQLDEFIQERLIQAIEIKPERQSVEIMSGQKLLNTKMGEVIMLCKPWISEGLTLLAGRPKIGKTTLARQLSGCVSIGRSFLDSECSQSRVLFISLEENMLIMQRKLVGMGFTADELANVDFAFEWPRGADGVQALTDYLDAHQDTKLVVIDSLTRIRDLPNKEKNVFMQDYEAMRMFHSAVKNRRGIAMVMLHQTRKGRSEDPIEDVSGSFGLTAACDNYFVFRLEKDNKYVIYCGGRLWDCDNDAFELTRQANVWLLSSPYEPLKSTSNDLTDEQKETLEWLIKAGGMGPTELSNALHISKQAVMFRFKWLIKKGKIKCEKGVYYAI